MASFESPIDRKAVVARHVVRLTKLDVSSPLSVGNGEFAFTADVTGLQTFPDAYFGGDVGGTPLCTMSQWGWHSSPAGPDVKPDAIHYTSVNTYGRGVPYLLSAKGQEATYNWLRENPHRLHLGRIGMQLRTAGGAEATPADLTDIEQTLDPWTGLLTSRFRFDGQPVVVETCCAGDTDAVAVRINSPLLADGRLAVGIAFPYGSPKTAAADWTQPAAHVTVAHQATTTSVDLARQLDDTHYRVTVTWQGGEQFAEAGPHQYRLATAKGATELSFVCAFSPKPPGDDQDRVARFGTPSRVFNPAEHGLEYQTMPPSVVKSFADAKVASTTMWEAYWNSGAAIDLAGSTDPRAHELERRIVLSQYLMKVNCAGSLPPAETGLTCNSWYGKFHLEMHWWHGVHFALWNRLQLLQRSLSYYERILPEAKIIAERQGYRGVRWPKMVDAHGIDSPSPVGPLLIWQQPHPIYYAELCYRQNPTPETLKQWATIVDQTAEFMASFAWRNEKTGHYDLGPPIKAVQENNDAAKTINPTYELTYWRFGLKTAQTWRERLGQTRKQQWDDVLTHLAPPPHKEGRYLYHEGLDATYTKWNWEHPAVIGALGMLDGDGIDPDLMRASVQKTMEVWQWDRCWGWDFPMTAMAAARCGRPDLAIDALFIDSKKNGYATSGNVSQRPELSLYLPANGGLLAAVAMMAGGWDDAPAGVDTPGFPKQGWAVRHEGFRPMI